MGERCGREKGENSQTRLQKIRFEREADRHGKENQKLLYHAQKSADGSRIV